MIVDDGKFGGSKHNLEKNVSSPSCTTKPGNSKKSCSSAAHKKSRPTNKNISLPSMVRKATITPEVKNKHFISYYDSWPDPFTHREVNCFKPTVMKFRNLCNVHPFFVVDEKKR